MKDRFGKLAALRRGAALIGIGATLVGCSRGEPKPAPVNGEPLPINGTPATNETERGDVSVFLRRLPAPNAFPRPIWLVDGSIPDTVAPAKDGGKASP